MHRRGPSRTQVIASFLRDHTHPDLADRFNDGMEVQVNVAQDHGEPACDPVTGKLLRGTYVDPDISDSELWYHFRIPKNANREPKDNDYDQTFDLPAHVEAIGITGWNWKRLRSIAVGFDFDAITGHAEGVGITQEELQIVRTRACDLDYVEVRKSTSGTGIHLWVLFDEENLPETMNHTEHAALGRAVLSRMSSDCGFDFAAAVDAAGGNMWFWHRKMSLENDGLSLVRSAQRPLTDYPPHWRDHLEVVKHDRRRTRVKGTRDNEEAVAIEHDAADRPRVGLDATHHEFMLRYGQTTFEGYWQQDHGLFTAHTSGVAQVFTEMGMRGVFKTISRGTDPREPNCWLYPLTDGAWRVFRYTKGVEEAETWETSTKGWTTCTINLTPSLEQVAKAFDGVRRPTKTTLAFVFRNPKNATDAVAAFGGELTLPDWLLSAAKPRPVTLMIHKAGGIHAEFPFKKDADEADGRDSDAMDKGWIQEKGPVWAKIIEADTESKVTNYEDLAESRVRQVSQGSEGIGLYINTHTRNWEKRTTDQVKTYLTHENITGGLQSDLLGWCSKYPYELVAKPFAPEYPGNREWNPRGAKLRFSPSPQPGSTPWWDRILTHLGAGLDDSVDADPWCQENGVRTGADYLRMWIANLIRFPERRLPLLAMFSPEQDKAGKSTLHEAICELFTVKDDAFTYGDIALSDHRGFNGELHGKALCVVEETNLATSKYAYNRIKAWVTNLTMQIHPKGEQSFPVVNVSHWIFSTNEITAIPIAPDDERIVLWEVMAVDKKVPKPKLLIELRKEGPNFLRRLMDLDLSDLCGRHSLPVLMTAEKVEAMDVSPIEAASLDGVRLRLARAIVDAVQNGELFLDLEPWRGTAEDVTEFLGDWDGEAGKKSLQARATRVGSLIMKASCYLAEEGIKLEREEGRKRTYVLSKLPQESVVT